MDIKHRGSGENTTPKTLKTLDFSGFAIFRVFQKMSKNGKKQRFWLNSKNYL